MQCMILNQSYEFLNIQSWYDSLLLVIEGKAVAIEQYDTIVRSAHQQWRLPAVVMLRYQVSTKSRTKLFNVPTKKAVLIRDNFECQYCGCKLTMGSGTRDHVIPLSKGGPNTLTNVVAACKPCNGRKDNKTLDQSGMTLRSKPRALTEEEKLKCLLKSFKSKERNAWLSCLKRLGLTLWTTGNAASA